MRPEMSDPASQDRELLCRWIETWHRAGEALDEIRRREIESVDTREAIRQIFGSGVLPAFQPSEPASGLIEQQAWFARLRSAQLTG